MLKVQSEIIDTIYFLWLFDILTVVCKVCDLLHCFGYTLCMLIQFVCMSDC